MIRVGFVLLVLCGAPAAQAAAPGHALGCFAAASSDATRRDSLRDCNKALADDKLAAADRAATLVNRGIIQMHAKRLDAAVADFDEAIRLRPETAEAYVNKGVVLLRMGNRSQEALALLSEGISRGPLRPAIAYYQRAIANEELGRVRDAYEDYSRAAELAPEWADPAEQLQRFQTVRKKTLQG